MHSVSNQQAPQLNITMDQTTSLVCEHCSGTVFQEGLFLRKVSKFLTGQPKDGLIPQPTFFCVKCQHVNTEFDINQPQEVLG